MLLRGDHCRPFRRRTFAEWLHQMRSDLRRLAAAAKILQIRPSLDHDVIGQNHHHALASCLGMISAQTRSAFARGKAGFHPATGAGQALSESALR
jgi:hypothetical protein